MNIVDFTNLKIYLIRDYKGRFIQDLGHRGYGETWVDAPEEARIFVTLKQAKQQITLMTNRERILPPPQILELSIGEITEVDLTKHIKKTREHYDKVQESRFIASKQNIVDRKNMLLKQLEELEKLDKV